MLEKSFRNKSQRHSFLLLTWQGWISPTEHFMTNILYWESSAADLFYRVACGHDDDDDDDDL